MEASGQDQPHEEMRNTLFEKSGKIAKKKRNRKNLFPFPSYELVSYQVCFFLERKVPAFTL